MSDPTRYPVCPCCGHVDEDAWEIDFHGRETTEVQCVSCDEIYEVTEHVRVTYTTAPGKKHADLESSE